MRGGCEGTQAVHETEGSGASRSSLGWASALPSASHASRSKVIHCDAISGEASEVPALNTQRQKKDPQTTYRGTERAQRSDASEASEVPPLDTQRQKKKCQTTYPGTERAERSEASEVLHLDTQRQSTKI